MSEYGLELEEGQGSSLPIRTPPHSKVAEQAVLGGLMLSTEAFDKIADVVNVEDFYSRDHQWLFKAISDLVEKGKPYDAVTLQEWFQTTGTARPIDPEYVLYLANTTPSAANIVAYAEIVRDKSMLRRLIDASGEITLDAMEPGGRGASEVIEEAERRIFTIAEASAGHRKDVMSSRDAAREAFKVLSNRYENRGQLTGASTGFKDLDRLTAGLQPSDLIIVAARPSMGKTAFALNLAEASAVKDKKAVLVFSMEMSSSQLALRLVSSVGRVDQHHLRTGDIPEEDWPKISNAIAQISDAKLFIDDTAALSPVELRSRARRIHREHGGLAMIVIDYLQLMQVPGNKENRATEISEISRSLKALAKELNVPVVALSQLNRSLEQRADKRPMMSDLRESGAIEQDADVIMFIYRDEYYHKDSEDKGMAEIIIGKQRNGPTDSVKLAFLGHYVRFESASFDSAFTGGF